MNALMNVNHFKETEVSWKSYKARINQVKSLDQKLVRTVKDKDDQTLKNLCKHTQSKEYWKFSVTSADAETGRTHQRSFGTL